MAAVEPESHGSDSAAADAVAGHGAAAAARADGAAEKADGAAEAEQEESTPAPTAVKAAYKVSIQAGSATAPKRFELIPGESKITIGRSPKSDVQVLLPGVSNQYHLELRLQAPSEEGAEPQLVVRDTSTNGTGLRKDAKHSTKNVQKLEKGVDTLLPEGSSIFLPFRIKALPDMTAEDLCTVLTVGVGDRPPKCFDVSAELGAIADTIGLPPPLPRIDAAPSAEEELDLSGARTQGSVPVAVTASSMEEKPPPETDVGADAAPTRSGAEAVAVVGAGGEEQMEGALNFLLAEIEQHGEDVLQNEEGAGEKKADRKEKAKEKKKLKAEKENRRKEARERKVKEEFHLQLQREEEKAKTEAAQTDSRDVEAVRLKEEHEKERQRVEEEKAKHDEAEAEKAKALELAMELKRRHEEEEQKLKKAEEEAKIQRMLAEVARREEERRKAEAEKKEQRGEGRNVDHEQQSREKDVSEHGEKHRPRANDNGKTNGTSSADATAKDPAPIDPRKISNKPIAAEPVRPVEAELVKPVPADPARPVGADDDEQAPWKRGRRKKKATSADEPQEKKMKSIEDPTAAAKNSPLWDLGLKELLESKPPLEESAGSNFKPLAKEHSSKVAPPMQGQTVGPKAHTSSMALTPQQRFGAPPQGGFAPAAASSAQLSAGQPAPVPGPLPAGVAPLAGGGVLRSLPDVSQFLTPLPFTLPSPGNSMTPPLAGFPNFASPLPGSIELPPPSAAPVSAPGRPLLPAAGATLAPGMTSPYGTSSGTNSCASNGMPFGVGSLNAGSSMTGGALERFGAVPKATPGLRAPAPSAAPGNSMFPSNVRAPAPSASPGNPGFAPGVRAPVPCASLGNSGFAPSVSATAPSAALGNSALNTSSLRDSLASALKENPDANAALASAPWRRSTPSTEPPAPVQNTALPGGSAALSSPFSVPGSLPFPPLPPSGLSMPSSALAVSSSTAPAPASSANSLPFGTQGLLGPPPAPNKPLLSGVALPLAKSMMSAAPLPSGLPGVPAAEGVGRPSSLSLPPAMVGADAPAPKLGGAAAPCPAALGTSKAAAVAAVACVKPAVAAEASVASAPAPASVPSATPASAADAAALAAQRVARAEARAADAADASVPWKRRRASGT